jgi:hypothetical protein
MINKQLPIAHLQTIPRSIIAGDLVKRVITGVLDNEQNAWSREDRGLDVNYEHKALR